MRKLTTWFLTIVIALITMATVGTKAYAETLKLPDSLTEIQEEAFCGNESIETAVIPYGAQTIGKKAFAYSGLVSIYMPETVTAIADDAFEGVDDMTIYAPSGSYAEEYANNHDYLWEDVGKYYVVKQYAAAYSLCEELEPAAYGALYLNGYEETTMEISGDEDEAYQEAVREFNQIEQKNTELYNEYQLYAQAIYDGLVSLQNAISVDNITYTDSGLLYEGPEFTYSVSGAGLDSLGDDFLVTSTTELDNGDISIGVNSNGKSYTLEGSLDGITVRGGEINLASMGMPDGISVNHSLKSRGIAINIEGMFQSAVDMCARVSPYINAIKIPLENSLKTIEQLIENAKTQCANCQRAI